MSNIDSTCEKVNDLINNPNDIPNSAQTLLLCFSDLVKEFNNFTTYHSH